MTASNFFESSSYILISLSCKSFINLRSSTCSVWLSSYIPPCPGKCFPVELIPASCIPSIKFDVIFITSETLLAKARSPITLEVSSSISRTGAKFISTPDAINSLEINQPTSFKNKSSSLAFA